jgi:hypothetical protein
MILRSLHPGPRSETSAFNRMRAFNTPRRALFAAQPHNVLLCPNLLPSRDPLLPSIANRGDERNHPILSNWLKRTTSPKRGLRTEADSYNRAETLVWAESLKSQSPLDLLRRKPGCYHSSVDIVLYALWLP